MGGGGGGDGGTRGSLREVCVIGVRIETVKNADGENLVGTI
jgi:hypothetical protein